MRAIMSHIHLGRSLLTDFHHKFCDNTLKAAFVIMQFNPIREKFFKDLEAKVGTPAFDAEFVSRAKAESEAATPKRAVDTYNALSLSLSLSLSLPLPLPLSLGF
jgi:hypothetical protein